MGRDDVLDVSLSGAADRVIGSSQFSLVYAAAEERQGKEGRGERREGGEAGGGSGVGGFRRWTPPPPSPDGGGC